MIDEVGSAKELTHCSSLVCQAVFSFLRAFCPLGEAVTGIVAQFPHTSFLPLVSWFVATIDAYEVVEQAVDLNSNYPCLFFL
jgi:hypothetical protein